MSDLGALLFARYAYPPNELGYCGPAGASALLRSDLPREIARRARGFSGAWAYLEYLGLGDPLDPAIGITWPDGIEPLLSPKDEAAPTLAEIRDTGLLATYEEARAFTGSL